MTSPKSRRPKVLLTRPTRPLTHIEQLMLDRLMVHHDQPNRDHLAKACLICGSIAEAPDQESRDFCVNNFDLTCCGMASTTITFSTQEV